MDWILCGRDRNHEGTKVEKKEDEEHQPPRSKVATRIDSIQWLILFFFASWRVIHLELISTVFYSFVSFVPPFLRGYHVFIFFGGKCAPGQKSLPRYS